MKISESNGQEKEDSKLKSTKRENLRLLITIENTKDKLELVWKNIMVLKRSGVWSWIEFQKNFRLSRIRLKSFKITFHLERI